MGGNIRAAEFKAQAGLIAVFENLDIDGHCMIDGFTIIHIPKGKKSVELDNEGSRFTDKSRMLTNKAKSGDYYIFHNIRAKCPGDRTFRKLNTMAMIIK